MRGTLPDTPAMQRLIHAAEPSGQHKGPVAVVDDNVWVGELLTEMLEAHGLDGVAYASTDDFLAGERCGLPGCLIIDQYRPEIEGLEVVQALRNKGVLVPTILLTGNSMRVSAGVPKNLESSRCLKSPLRSDVWSGSFVAY